MTGHNDRTLNAVQLPNVLDRYIQGARVMQNIVSQALREAQEGEDSGHIEQTLVGAFWCIGAIWDDEATLMKWLEDQRREPIAPEAGA